MINIGLIGCGNIGIALTKALNDQPENSAVISTVYDNDQSSINNLLKSVKNKPLVSNNLDNLLSNNIDLIIEAAGQQAVIDYIPQALNARKHVMIMSVGAFTDTTFYKNLMKLAKEKNVKIYIPSGAIAGIDALKAASLSDINQVILITSKPLRAWNNIPYLKEKKIDLNSIVKPTIIFEGNADQAAKLFPANINVSVLLSLAGIGVTKTAVKLIANPDITQNIHELLISGNFGKLTIKLENSPSPNNPKTSYLAILSALKTIKQIDSEICLGT